MKYSVKKTTGLQGRFSVPGDKSISHRAVMFSSLADGITEIQGLSFGEDVRSTISCFRQLGIEITIAEDIVRIVGQGLNGLQPSRGILDAGNSGTTTRLMSGILAGQKFDSEITGDASLRSRPMKRVIEPLRLMGADISARAGNYAPLKIRGSQLIATNQQLKIASAQVKSCLMLAGMYADGETIITEPAASRDHSERMLSYLGADVKNEGNQIRISGWPNLKAADLNVPGDISSAAFFLTAATLFPGAAVTIENLGVNPTRTGILDVLKMMGAKISSENESVLNNEPVASVTATASGLRGIEMSGDLIPRIIDEIPILAVAATQAKGTTVVREAAELRVKETDRIQTVVENLRRMGVEVIENPDGFVIDGPQKLTGAVINSFGDHRIAMAFSIAGLLAEGETVIENADCADVSYPGFFTQLEALYCD
ncbi:3-phosphoshikimate 1-carboxyvinyltransferase [bacterium]|nr:3-phosphoshikimate 1-carboxyvinyltransferase [bacterium]